MGENEKGKDMSAKVAEKNLEETLAEGISEAPAPSLSNLRDAMHRADTGYKTPVPRVGSLEPDYRPKHAIGVKEIIMAKVEGLNNEISNSQMSLDSKRMKFEQNKEMIQGLLRENSTLLRDIHDLEMIVELNRMMGSALDEGHVSLMDSITKK